MNPNRAQLRKDLLDIVHAGLEAARADRLVEAALRDPPAALATAPQIRLAAVGKAAAAMSRAFAGWAGDRLCGGVIVVPEAVGAAGPAIARLEVLGASHPVPDARSEAAARRLLDEAAAAAREGVPLAVLLSGGASSLAALPVAGLRLEDKAATAEALMRAGAAIDELNAVRKHLSAIKGGRLAAAAGRSITLAVSDVVAPVADDPSVIGSGPTVADPTTYREALAVVARYRVEDRLPPAALEILRRGGAGEIDETIKPGDSRLLGGDYRVVGSRSHATAGARAAAEARGYAVAEISEPVTGQARAAGARLADVAAGLAAEVDGPVCLIAAGETTVEVRGTGRGGRNQELALSAALAARALRLTGRPFAFASAGTDGIDGPTDAAGAIADEGTLDRALAAGLDDPRDYLDENDTYRFFDALGDLIRTGPTGTNVGDLQVVLIG